MAAACAAQPTRVAGAKSSSHVTSSRSSDQRCRSRAPAGGGCRAARCLRAVESSCVRVGVRVRGGVWVTVGVRVRVRVEVRLRVRVRVEFRFRVRVRVGLLAA